MKTQSITNQSFTGVNLKKSFKVAIDGAERLYGPSNVNGYDLAKTIRGAEGKKLFKGVHASIERVNEHVFVQGKKGGILGGLIGGKKIDFTFYAKEFTLDALASRIQSLTK